MIMDRKQAWALLNEYVSNPALIRHGLAVEAAMRHYARLQDADEELWGVTGLLHDFDYERHPDPPEHTRAGAKTLRQQGAGEALIGAILSHAEWNLDEYPRDTPLRKTLFAVDELCGFIVACALVRPARLAGMTAKSVRKKMKQASFAGRGKPRGHRNRRGTARVGPEHAYRPLHRRAHPPRRHPGPGRARSHLNARGQRRCPVQSRERKRPVRPNVTRPSKTPVQYRHAQAD
jgi:putative nucleotidyltransferase with HDIG domain